MGKDVQNPHCDNSVILHCLEKDIGSPPGTRHGDEKASRGNIFVFYVLRFMPHQPWDFTEVPRSFGLILPGKPHLQQLLCPFKEVCTVLLHREARNTNNRNQ